MATETPNNLVPLRWANDSPTFGDLATHWLRTEAQRLVEPANERRHIDHLRELWPLTEAELRPWRAKAALYSLLKPTGPLAKQTVNKVRATAARIIRDAQLNERWRGPNPFDLVPRLREPRPHHLTLSLAQCRQVLPHLREDRRREVLTMLYIGPRPGEWKALRKSDIDWPRAVVTIHRSNARNETKTGAARVLPVPAGLMPILEEAARLSPVDLLFPALGGGLQRADAKLSRMLHSALVRADLISGYEYICRRKGCGHRQQRRERVEVHCPACGFRLWRSGVALPIRYYDLRHSAATLHREAGADPLAIQIALGHAPESLTDSLYTHLSLDYLRRELDKLKI